MKRSKTQLLRSLAAVMLLGAGLASCSQDDIADNRQGELLPPGEYPLILNAGGLEAIATPVQQSAPTTRGTMEGNWDGLDGQSVAVQVYTKVKEYRIVVDKMDSKKAKLEPAGEDNTLYWESTAPHTVKAWYPYREINDDINDKINLPTKWNTEKDFEDNDWLGAVNVMSFGDQTSHTLQFNHLLSKITVNLKQSDYLSAYEQEQVNVMCKLSSNSFTFKGVKYDNTNNVVEFISEGPTSEDVTPMRLDAPAGAFASFMCLANPDMESIDITVTVDGTEYKATDLKPQEPFKPGHTYTFNITVKAEGLKVSVNDGIVWDDDGAVGSGSVDLDNIVLNDDSDREFQLSNGDEITVKGNENGTQTRGSLTFNVPQGSTVTVNLDNTNINIPQQGWGGDLNNITVTGGGTVVFNLIGENILSLEGVANDSWNGIASVTNGIYADGSNIKIAGEGKLRITGWRGGSGICASSKEGKNGDITIENTTIDIGYIGCMYSKLHAFIGSKQNETCGNINITNSDIIINVKTFFAWPYPSYRPDINARMPALIGCGHQGSCGSIMITLSADQNNKSDFLSKLKQESDDFGTASDRVVRDEDKVGKGVTGTSCGIVTWKDSSGKALETIPAVP